MKSATTDSNTATMTRSRSPIDVSATLLDTDRYQGETRLCWSTLFGNEHPVELEVGSGKGLFLVNAACDRPGHNFLGIELSRKYARMAAERIVKRGMTNVKIWPGDAREVVALKIPDASLRAVHIYFPDPWWKKRHKKRRVFTEAFVTRIARRIEPGGELHVATDVEEYHQVIRTLMAAERLLTEITAPRAKEPEHELDYLSNFERKFRLEGRPIFRSSYQRSWNARWES
jgi:tRNA (guanine-N7-)-methyltransferase